MIERPELRLTDLIRGEGGFLSLTKVSILVSGIWATVVIFARFFVPQDAGPSDELVLGLVTIFVLRRAWAESRWSGDGAAKVERSKHLPEGSARAYPEEENK